MKLPIDAFISEQKLTDYLLKPKIRNDKSKWLSYIGYNLANWQILENDLRNQVLPCHAKPTDKTQYGQTYEIIGELIGPNGKKLSVCTIWMTEFLSGITKFITMFPAKRTNR